VRTNKKSIENDDPCGSLKKEYEASQVAYDLVAEKITLQELLIAELKKKMEDVEDTLKEAAKESAIGAARELADDVLAKETRKDLAEAARLTRDAKAAYDDYSKKYKLANDLLEILKKRREGLANVVREKEAAWGVCKQAAALVTQSTESGKVLPVPQGEDRIMRGTIIENSLRDKSILEQLTITRTWFEGDWVLHDVETNEEQVLLIQNFLNDGPWCVHFWEQGNDEVIVVFKDKIFRIAYSNKDSWKEAIAYGKSLGIPQKQLDFVI
jgi:DNA primase